MSGTGSERNKWYSRSSSKDRKEREKEKARHTGQKDPSTQRGGSGAKGGGGHGQKRSGDDDVPTHMNPITVTTSSTAATNTKGDLEYFKEQYRQLKSENASLHERVEELGEEMESAKARARVNNQRVVETNDLMNEKEKELNRLQKSLEKAQSDQDGAAEQLKALQKRYTQLSQDKDKIEAEKMTLDQSHKERIADLEQKLSQSSKDLSHFHTELQKAQDDDLTLNQKEEKIRELEKNLETSKAAHQEEVDRVKRRNDQITNMKATQKNLMAQLNSANESKHALEVEYQQFKEHYGRGDKEKIKQLEDTVVQQTFEYAQEVEKIKNETAMVKTKLQEAERKLQTLQETNDEKEENIQESKKIIDTQATKIEDMKAAIKENHSKHQDQLSREKKEKEDLMRQLQEIENEKYTLEQQVKDKDQETRIELSKLMQENKVNVLQLEEKHKVELEEAVKEATADKDNLKQIQQQHHFVVEQKEKEIKTLRLQCEEKARQIKELENILRKQSDKPTGQVEELVREKEALEQQMKEGYKEREDRIAELEEFINDQVVELDKMEAAMKQTVANKELCEKELHEALEKKQADLATLEIACENKDEEIRNLDQSLSQMSIDKEEMERINMKLVETEEKLAQASKKKEYSVPVNTDSDSAVSLKKLTKENSDLNNKCLELKQENKSLTKRCEEFRKSCEMLRGMLQKDPGKEMQVELAKKNLEIDQLKQQITKLQKECEAINSSTTEVSNKPTHEADQEFHSSVQRQPQDLSDQSTELHHKVKQLEAELESTKLTVEAERKNYERIKEQMLHQSISQSTSIDTEELQKECERQEQTYEQLYVSYQSLIKRYREKEDENIKVNSELTELQTKINEQNIEMLKIQQELESVSGHSQFIQEQNEKLVLAEKDRDTTTTMILDQKQSEEIKHTELNAKITEMRNNYLLLLSQVESKNTEIDELERKLKQVTDSKEAEIADLTANMRDLESRLAQRSAVAVTATPATSDVASNIDFESLHGFSLETAIPSPTSSSLTIPTQEQPSLQLKKKDQTIVELQKKIRELQAQLAKSSDDTGVSDPCVEHTQTGGVGDSPEEGNCGANDSKSKKIDQLLQELKIEKQAKKEVEDNLAREQETTKKSQEIFSSYEAQLQNLRSEKNEIEKQMKLIQAEMQEGYKEREDRIAELEEFINDQVIELDKMEAAMKQTVTNKQAIEENLRDVTKSKTIMQKQYEKVSKHYEQAKDQVFELETQITTLKQVNEHLTFENDSMKLTNHNFSEEVARLIQVDQELKKTKERLMQVESDLTTKEVQIQVYKEDFEQERRDRENAHRIKEEEIQKVRVEQEASRADHHENLRRIQDNYNATINTHKQKVTQLTKDNERLTTECTRFQAALQKERKEAHTKTHQITTDNEKLHNEVSKLRTALEKERKEAQTKVDIYKNKTEQFQMQWKRRAEAEKVLKDLSDELKAQRQLNAEQQITIDDLLRKNKGIDTKIPANVSGTPVDTPQQHQDHERISRDAAYHSMIITQDYPSKHHQSGYSPSMGPKYPQHDPTVGHTNAEYHYQQQQQKLHQQEVWQQEYQLQQQYQMNQQQQNLRQRGQGRGTFRNQPVHAGSRDMYAGGIDYPHKHLPSPRDNFGGQPMSLGSMTMSRDYNTAGTNAGMQQNTPNIDDASHDRLNNPPRSLDSFRSKNPAPVSEGINEEIRVQADLQRMQHQQNEFESGLAYDPYLTCHKCKRQFREGQLPEYRHHIDNCQK